MAEATTNGVPSDATRALIRTALEVGATTRKAVDDFRDAARRGKDAFNAEVDPLHLPDDEYERVFSRSKLRAVLDLAYEMATTLTGVDAA